MVALVLVAGMPPSKQLYDESAKRAEYIVCADGAANWALAYGAKLDVLVGDLDSISEDALAKVREQGAKVQKLPPRKNETDTHIAVDVALEAGASELILLGATGGRLDHTLANIHLLVHIAEAGASGCVRDAYGDVYVSTGTQTFSGNVGQELSVVPLSDDVCVTLEGLEYPLDHYNMKLEFPRGISNVFAKPTAQITARGGYVAVIYPRE